MKIYIKTASIEDLDKVYDLNIEFAKLYNALDKLTLSKEEFVQDINLFNCRVAIANDQVVGFSSFFMAYYTWIGKAVYLDDLFVTASFRKHGVGNKLLEDVIDFAKQSNCKRLVWQVSDWNVNAHEFYIRKGASLHKGEINCVLNLL